MMHDAQKGPSYEQLRPFKGLSTAFPVYPHLVDDLVSTAAVYRAQAAHVCSVLSGWAYSSCESVATMMVRLGLEHNRCRLIGVANDAMFVCSTAYVVQSGCGRLLLLAYRGTDPADFIGWLTDADVAPTKVPLSAKGREGSYASTVHGGFYRNQRATWFAVEQALRLALAGQSVLGDGERVAPPEAVYITGHSLGGAMAALAAFRVATDDAYGPIRERLRGVYTYGQPMIGNEIFASECEADPVLGRLVFRHIYKNDLVPVLPPTLTGDFRHFGPEFRSIGEPPAWQAGKPGDYAKQLSHFAGPVVVAGSAFAIQQVPMLRRLAELAHQVPLIERAGLVYSLYDHVPTYYIQTSQPPGVITEFGDA